jgi:hypothetical protein
MVKAIRVRECRIIDNLKITIVDAIGDGKWYYAYVVDEV